MKRYFSPILIITLVLFCGCSKDILKSYDERIVGTWQITDIDKVGIGSNASSLTFREGTFTFYENGTLEYVDTANTRYTGSWEINKRVINNNTIRNLHVTAIDFTNQQVLTEIYDDMQFTGTNRFRGIIETGLHKYITHFRR